MESLPLHFFLLPPSFFFLKNTSYRFIQIGNPSYICCIGYFNGAIVLEKARTHHHSLLMILDSGCLFLCWEPTVHSQKIPGAGYLPACCLHTLFPSPLAFPMSSKVSTKAQEIITITGGDVLDQAAASEWRTSSGLHTVKWLGVSKLSQKWEGGQYQHQPLAPFSPFPL